MPRGLKDAGVPRLSLTGPSNLPLPYLSFPTDKLMPATPRERKKSCSTRPLWVSAGIFAAPCLILNHLGYFGIFGTVLPPLPQWSREAVKWPLN